MLGGLIEKPGQCRTEDAFQLNIVLLRKEGSFYLKLVWQMRGQGGERFWRLFPVLLKVAEILVYGLAEDGLRLLYCVAVIDHKVTDTENLSVIKMVFVVVEDGAVIASIVHRLAHITPKSCFNRSTV